MTSWSRRRKKLFFFAKWYLDLVSRSSYRGREWSSASFSAESEEHNKYGWRGPLRKKKREGMRCLQTLPENGAVSLMTAVVRTILLQIEGLQWGNRCVTGSGTISVLPQMSHKRNHTVKLVKCPSKCLLQFFMR